MKKTRSNGTRGATMHSSRMALPPPTADVRYEGKVGNPTNGKRDLWLEGFTIVLVIYGIFAALALPSMSSTNVLYVVGGAVVIALAGFIRPLPEHVIDKRDDDSSPGMKKSPGTRAGGSHGSAFPRRGSWTASMIKLPADEVLDAGLDSFPASDPPSWSPLRIGSPARGKNEMLH